MTFTKLEFLYAKNMLTILKVFSISHLQIELHVPLIPHISSRLYVVYTLVIIHIDNENTTRKDTAIKSLKEFID